MSSSALSLRDRIEFDVLDVNREEEKEEKEEEEGEEEEDGAIDFPPHAFSRDAHPVPEALSPPFPTPPTYSPSVPDHTVPVGASSISSRSSL